MQSTKHFHEMPPFCGPFGWLLGVIACQGEGLEGTVFPGLFQRTVRGQGGGHPFELTRRRC